MKNLKDVWDKSPELLNGLGADALAGSGFECEEPDGDFAMQDSEEVEE